jgi:hypothetical protein
MGGRFNAHEETRNPYKSFVEKPEGKSWEIQP